MSEIFGSKEMREPAPSEFIPRHRTSAETAYQLVKDETFPQTQPRLNLATFVTTYMDDYGTRLMNEAVGVNFIDETEYPRVAVMCGRCINMVANMWNTPEKEVGTWAILNDINIHLDECPYSHLSLRAKIKEF